MWGLRGFLPPVLIQVLKQGRTFIDPQFEEKRTIRKLKDTTLFSGDDALFKKLLARCTSYGEIGLGQSTVYASQQNHLEQIVSIDSSAEWIELVTPLVSKSRVTLKHIDFGPVKQWGKPESYARIDEVDRYALAVLEDGTPELILIDGRFRVFVFLSLVKHAPVGTQILFDDYSCRPHYLIVEEILRPIESCGKQSLFVIDEEAKTHPNLQIMIDRFRYVMD